MEPRISEVLIPLNPTTFKVNQFPASGIRIVLWPIRTRLRSTLFLWLGLLPRWKRMRCLKFGNISKIQCLLSLNVILSIHEICYRVTFVENFWKFWPNQTPGKLIRVTKRAINSTEDATSGNKTTIIYSTPLSPAHPRPGGILTPKLRDVDTVSDNVTGNGANNSSTYFNMKGSWDHFKTSWMNFLHYFGFW